MPSKASNWFEQRNIPAVLGDRLAWTIFDHRQRTLNDPSVFRRLGESRSTSKAAWSRYVQTDTSRPQSAKLQRMYAEHYAGGGRR